MNIFLGYLLTYVYVFFILIILGILKSKKKNKRTDIKEISSYFNGLYMDNYDLLF